MTISVWRYCHLALALVSSGFLIVAAGTGIILSLEPIQQASRPYQPENLAEIPVAQTLEALQDSYPEVLSLQVDANGFLLAEVVTDKGDAESVFVHPRTGETLGTPGPQHPIFQWATNLHRSLFLKGTGRFLVGLVSLLLCLIAITGLLLIAKRQGGFSRLFSRVRKDYFALRYHVELGRWMLVPILIVAGTGVYLSAEKFSLLPSMRVSHPPVEPDLNADTSTAPADLEFFQSISLKEVRSITFPFSEFPEDYFELSLRDRELLVHQYTGEVLSEQRYPLPYLASQLSLTLHTGQGSVAWSLVLLLTSGSIVFFIFSGFRMWRRRLKNTGVPVTAADKDACRYIILVGSETGTTFAFAQALEKALILAGESVFVCQINEYTPFRNARELIFLTATYGEGEAPTNARKIRELVPAALPENPVGYSVVGFGSLTYPGYCQFARDLDAFLGTQPNFTRSMPLNKINNQSFTAFRDWASRWGREKGLTLIVEPPAGKVKKQSPKPFEIVKRTPLNADDTFLMHLKPLKKVRFQSGDLWEYHPGDGGPPRLYSIARYGGHLLLSIKKHPFGQCSTFLSGVTLPQTLQAGIRRNPGFHFPKNAPEIICIANGTGIAPFLGLIDENHQQVPIELFWGGRTPDSLELYQPYLDEALRAQKLARCHVALSQGDGPKAYVQDVLEREGTRVARKMEMGAVVMICGSLAMQHAVLDVLERQVATNLEKPLNAFEHSEQLKMDCY